MYNKNLSLKNNDSTGICLGYICKIFQKILNLPFICSFGEIVNY